MKSAPSTLLTTVAALAALAIHATAAPTHKLYNLYATQSTSTQLLGLNWYHAGATISSSELDPLEKFPSATYYLQGGRLFTPYNHTLFPDIGYDVGSVGDTPGAFDVAWAQFGRQGRDDWVLEADGGLVLTAGGPRSSFFKCRVPSAEGGGPVDSLGFGNFFENGSLPNACQATVKIFATPV